MELDKVALDRHITGNWGEDQFRDWEEEEEAYYFEEEEEEEPFISDDHQFPSGTYVRVKGYGGIAFYVHKSREDEFICVMVGDDREWTFDRDDLTELDQEEFCGGCGQIGCGHG